MITEQLISTIEHCHSLNICHRDIKSDNVLIDKNTLKIKLLDFGLGLKLSTRKSLRVTRCGTLRYMAPEIIAGTKSSPFGLDAWALGVLVTFMATGCFPFEGNF